MFNIFLKAALWMPLTTLNVIWCKLTNARREPARNMSTMKLLLNYLINNASEVRLSNQCTEIYEGLKCLVCYVFFCRIIMLLVTEIVTALPGYGERRRRSGGQKVKFGQLVYLLNNIYLQLLHFHHKTGVQI